MKRGWLFLLMLTVALIALPPTWYPTAVRIQLSAWFGATAFRALPESSPSEVPDVEVFCQPDLQGWRRSHHIEGVSIAASKPCVADNPYLVAAFVRGTNNISRETLLKSGLTLDAVEKDQDLDGDGDPDVIHIRLEIAELNGASTESDRAVTQFAIAPGINPGLWVFAPKLAGMARENFESVMARTALRLPSPAIRVEQGDQIVLTLENTHYMPHTLHLHGADHGFTTSDGGGNDGVPLTSEVPVLPGGSRSYELTPRTSGTMFYHCHVQPQVHVSMGLQGLFIIEENRPDNWLQTMNIGAGFVRAPSVAVRESFSQEYDLQYSDIDKQLNERIQQAVDPRIVTRLMHRDYDVTDSSVDYFVLNGRSFPYTFRESILVTEPDELIKLRVLNAGRNGIAWHTHGHKYTITAKNGTVVPASARAPQDVAWLATSERMEVSLSTKNDGLNSYGAGIWLFHDHRNRGVTSNGIGPGGNISAIVYDEYLDSDGWPKTQNMAFDPYFTEAYYRRDIPVWQSYAPELFSDPASDWLMLARVAVLCLAVGGMIALMFSFLRFR